MENLNFVSIRVQTANSDRASICFIELAEFENGELKRRISQLINPMEAFHYQNVEKHGIDEKTVSEAPLLLDFFPVVQIIIAGKTILHHTSFHKEAILQYCQNKNLELPETEWLNTASVVRRFDEQFREKGYGLKNVVQKLNIKVNADDEESALATGLVFIKIYQETKKDIPTWVQQVKKKSIKPKSKNYPQKITGEILKPDFENVKDKLNPFYKKKVVISGTYEFWPNRKDLAILLKSKGADIDSNVMSSTNILCAGKGVGPSKFKKMNENIANGKDSIILYEPDILRLLGIR